MQVKLHSSKVLFYYDNIVKCTDIFLLRIIQNKFYEQYKDFIDIDRYKAINDDDLLYFYCSRTIKNPLEWLKKKDFDYEANYKYLHDRYKNLYINGIYLDIVKSFDTFLRAYFIENIILYSPTYDKRISFDIASNFTSDKYMYITGPLEEVIDSFKPEAVFYPYADKEILDLAKIHPEIIFNIPTYGFNLDDDLQLKGLTDEHNNIATYPVIRRKYKYFG